MTKMPTKTFSLPHDQVDLLKMYARLLQYNSESMVARIAFKEFFENHKDELVSRRIEEDETGES